MITKVNITKDKLKARHLANWSLYLSVVLTKNNIYAVVPFRAAYRLVEIGWKFA